jgi:hypothetical protein
MAKIRLTESKLEKIIEKIIKEYGSYNYGGTRTIVINGGESYGDLDVPMEFPDDIQIRYKYRYESGMKSGDYDVPDDDADFYMTKPQVFIHDEDYNAMIPEIQEWVEDNWGEISGEFYEDEFEEVSNELNESKNTDNIDTLICESIMLSENVVDKFKDLLKKGLVTSAIVTSLLASQNISAQDKKEVQNLAQQNNIEVKQEKNDSAKTITSEGIGKSFDSSTARKMAISNAKTNAYKQIQGEVGNEVKISNVDVVTEKFSKTSDGSYVCKVTCTISFGENKTIVESIVLSENVVDKFKDLLKKGLVTSAIVASLLASQNISAQDKKEVQSLSQQNNIEIQGKNFIEGNQVTSHGVGRGIDAEAARKKAVSSAKYQAAMQVVGQNENLDFSFSDVKIKKEKITKGADGNYICEITCVVTVNVNDVNLTNK